jgi:hypothetical protein
MRRAAALILLGVLAAAGCSAAQAPGPAKPPATVTGSAASPGAVPDVAGACPAAIMPRPLPAWARAGFTPPTVAMPYVLGAQGNIVAILWAERDALHAPPLPGRGNKILWVSRPVLPSPAALLIRATLNGTGRTVIREVNGGPGPSIIDLPAAGCWSLDLSWSGHHDHLELRYAAS